MEPELSTAEFLIRCGFGGVPGGSGWPKLQVNINKHDEHCGHTWYLLECAVELQPQPVTWSTGKRLKHLREELYEPVKTELGDDRYGRLFGQTPFARRGGVPGTTQRLATWCGALAKALGAGELTPELSTLTLRFLNAPRVARDEELRRRAAGGGRAMTTDALEKQAPVAREAGGDVSPNPDPVIQDASEPAHVDEELWGGDIEMEAAAQPPSHNGAQLPQRSLVELVRCNDASGVEACIGRLNAQGGIEGVRAAVTICEDDEEYRCALHFAAQLGHAEVLRLLLGTRANPNPFTDAGNSPLHLAADMGHVEAVRLLLGAGADPALRNGFGNRPGEGRDPEDEEDEELRARRAEARQLLVAPPSPGAPLSSLVAARPRSLVRGSGAGEGPAGSRGPEPHAVVGALAGDTSPRTSEESAESF